MKGKDFGFVHMLSRESAADAIVGLKGKSFNGNNLHVTLSNKRGMAINRNGKPKRSITVVVIQSQPTEAIRGRA